MSSQPPRAAPVPVPPREKKLDRTTRTILFIFIATIVLFGGLAYYVAFFTDWRDQAVDAFNTETAEVYHTAAANSTATASVILTATAAAGAPTEAPATPAGESGSVSVATAPAAETGP